MKKLRSLILLLLCALSLTACVGEGCALPRRRDLLFLKKHPIAPFDTAQTGRMANTMNGNRCLAVGDRLYTLELGDDQRSCLMAYRLEGGRVSRPLLLAENCAPRWLCEHEGVLYYVNDSNGGCIEKLDTGSLERQVLVALPCSYLQIKDERLYYRGERGWLCSVSLSGEERQVVMDKSCCYPYFLGDLLIYQSESEGEILKLRYSGEGKVREIALTEAPAYAPTVIGDRLYYTSRGQVYSMGLDGLEAARCESPAATAAAEYITEGGQWYARGITEGYGISQWRCPLPDGSAEELKGSGYIYCDFLSEELRVDSHYFADSRLRGFVISGPEGELCEYLYGRISNLD